MLNEFVEKVIVHEGVGRGKERRQRLDIYLNFIGAFEVPAHIATPMEQEEEKRLQEEQAAQAELSKQRAKARYEKRKAEKREFTARKKPDFSHRRNKRQTRNTEPSGGHGRKRGGRKRKLLSRRKQCRRCDEG